MPQPRITASSAVGTIVRRGWHCPSGIGAGVLGVAAALIWTPAVVGATLFVLLLGGAALLAWSGEPVAGLVEVPAPEPTMPGLEMIHIPGGVFRLLAASEWLSMGDAALPMCSPSVPSMTTFPSGATP